MSPLQIEVLFHYYISPTEHRCCADNVPAWPSIREWALENKLLQMRLEPSDYGATYEIAPRGMALLEYIMDLPLPEQRWVMPELA